MEGPVAGFEEWGEIFGDDVMAEAVRWGKRGARVNTISPGIIITPLANDELRGPRGPAIGA